MTDLDFRDSEVSTNGTVLEQSNEVNTLIDEVNEEYSFWCPHQDKEYPVDSIHTSTKEEYHEDSTGVLDDTRQDILNVKYNVKSEN